MRIEAAVQLRLLALEAVGTSEGAVKGWDTRGRGRKIAETHGFTRQPQEARDSPGTHKEIKQIPGVGPVEYNIDQYGNPVAEELKPHHVEVYTHPTLGKITLTERDGEEDYYQHATKDGKGGSSGPVHQLDRALTHGLEGYPETTREYDPTAKTVGGGFLEGADVTTKKLTRDEVDAMKLYQGYAADDTESFPMMQDTARGKNDTMAKEVADLSNAISKSTVNNDVTTYRGLALSDKELKELQKNKLLPNDGGFQSTSLDIHQALAFTDDRTTDIAHPNPVILEIALKKGDHALGMDTKKSVKEGTDQQELLLDKSTKYKIHDMVEKNGRTHLLVSI